MTINHASQAYSYPLIIKQLWHSALQVYGDQEVVYKDRLRMSYRELYLRVGKLAQVLTDLGVGQSDTVAVMEWDSHRYLETLYAVPMIGATLMTANIRLAPEQLLYTLEHSQASVLLVNSDFSDLLAEIIPKLDRIKHIIWISDDGSPVPDLQSVAGEYEQLTSAFDGQFDFPEFDENTTATTFYTTGTTGLPKGVFFSHRQIVLQALAAMAGLASPSQGQRFHRGDVYMPLTPMFHVHAWGIPFVALMLGVKQVYPGRYIPSEILSLIKSEGVTFSHCVPTILQMLFNEPAAADTDFSNWTVVIGGSALSESLARAAMDKGIDIFGGYGMSETGPILSLAQVPEKVQAEDELRFRCKAGAPVPLVHLRTVDEAMNDVEGDGEIVARSPWLTQSYVARPEASEELWAGGWLHTQDIGFRERGYIKISDRLKDVIKSGGEWVSSLALEDLISRHADIAEVAVIGVPDEKWGERPLAIVVPKAGRSISEKGIVDHLTTYANSGEISKYAIPAKIVHATEIPKTSVGKIDKKELRRRYS